MKKILLSLAVLVAFSTASFAQLSGGARLGVNLSNFGGDDGEGDMKAGLQLGLYLVGNLSEKLAVQPELLYSSYGAKEDFSGTEVTTALSYISIPVLLRYNVNEMINIHVGPQFGILASAKAKTDDDDVDIKDEMKGMDLGLALGVGLDFGKFNAGLRYYGGLSNIVDADDVDVKNTAFNVVIGYKLFGGE
jgi:hypothetical protein